MSKTGEGTVSCNAQAIGDLDYGDVGTIMTGMDLRIQHEDEAKELKTECQTKLCP